uniref:Acyl-CoA oxidase like n=1 Tax=Sinocyclocheilus grahami TaxID=75366 RepID=A0A672KZ89_SINGR
YKSWIHNSASFIEKVILSESGEKYAQIKHCLQAKTLQFTGMFAMTERGHGSNVRGIITEARYDQSTQEFIIHTPSEDAQKMYIGNAMKGNYAAVFKMSFSGPHCFIVPIRDQNGFMWPGVTTIDMKHKQGLHGVDNGILIFNNVRIPRGNLLREFGSVSADGLYSSPVLSKSSRFNAMLAALTPTRPFTHCVFSTAGARHCSTLRRQFGPKDQDEVKIIQHQMQYLRLMLAAALALTFTTRYAAGLVDDALCQGQDLQSNPYSTWENIGFMMENRIPSLKCDSDVFVTFVGDNMAMLQVFIKKNKDEFFMAWNACLHHVNTLAMAHRHRVTLEQFALALRQCNIKRGPCLFCLHGTRMVYQERAWYLENNYMTLNTSRQIRSQLLELCRSVKGDVLKVVDDFNIPSCCIQAPIAGVACPRTEWAFNPLPQYPSSTQPQSKL